MAKIAKQTARIIATRPGSQNTSWCLRLQRLGFNAVALPVLAVKPVEDASRQRFIKKQILDLDNFHKIIFVSQNAVQYGFDWIDQFWPQLPVKLEYFAIGKKTAEAIAKRCETMAEIHHSPWAMNSEELLAHANLKNVANQKIIIFRGVGGRPQLADELKKKGAEVELCELYWREEEENLLVNAGALDISSNTDISLLFSGETLTYFTSMLKRLAVEGWQDIHLVVPGERVAKIAQNLGFNCVFQADNATEEAMLQTLDQILMVGNNE